MRQLVLIAIRAYQVLTPKRFRGNCLFLETCSNHVYRITKERGVAEGMKALRYRYLNCRPGYQVIPTAKGPLLVSTAKEVFTEKEIKPTIVQME